jgi:hypothetical protein
MGVSKFPKLGLPQLWGPITLRLDLRLKWGFVATLALGSQPWQKGLKGVGQEECEKEDSHSQVSSPFGSWSLGGLPKPLESDCKGQNTSHWEVFYIIGKLLKCRYLKWAHMTRLDICNTIYGKHRYISLVAQFSITSMVVSQLTT